MWAVCAIMLINVNSWVYKNSDEKNVSSSYTGQLIYTILSIHLGCHNRLPDWVDYKKAVKVTQYVRLFETPWTISSPALQARTLGHKFISIILEAEKYKINANGRLSVYFLVHRQLSFHCVPRLGADNWTLSCPLWKWKVKVALVATTSLQPQGRIVYGIFRPEYWR